MSDRRYLQPLYYLWPRPYWTSRPLEGIGLAYPLNVEDRLVEGHFPTLDSDGLPKRIRNGAKVINITTVTALGLASWNRYLDTGQQAYLGTSRKMLDWCVDQLHDFERLNFTYKHPWLLASCWESGMAYGEFLSLASRHLKVSDVGSRAATRISYACAGALRRLRCPVREGGVMRRTHCGVVFEEIPTPKMSAVLNGHLYTLIGLWDYRQRAVEAEDLFREGIQYVRGSWKEYIRPHWSLYSLGEYSRLASYQYHTLHIAQLTFLSKAADDSQLAKASSCLESQLRSPSCRIRAGLEFATQRLRSSH